MPAMRANPVEMRKALQAVDTLKMAGLLFVPMPVLNEEDGMKLLAEMMQRLETAIQEAEA